MQGRRFLDHPDHVIRRLLLGPRGHLLHKATLPKLGVKGDLHKNIKEKKKPQRSSQNGDTKKHAPKEKAGESPEKELN